MGRLPRGKDMVPGWVRDEDNEWTPVDQIAPPPQKLEDRDEKGIFTTEYVEKVNAEFEESKRAIAPPPQVRKPDNVELKVSPKLKEAISTLNNKRGADNMSVSFGTHAVGTDKEATKQYVVYVRHENKENSIEIIRFYKREDMYANGLEAKHKPLVDIATLADGIYELLDAYLQIGKLNEATWEQIMKSYAPFIDKRLKFKRFEAFVSDEGEDDWV